jgi:CheY-like chemotaxis protein
LSSRTIKTNFHSCAVFSKRLWDQFKIQKARSLQSGLKQVRQAVPVLIVLDMTLPNFDPTPDDPDGQTHNFGGREFLRQLERFEIKVPVVVVTQFTTIGKGRQAMSLQDLDKELHAAFAPNYVGSVYYHATIDRWKEDLQRLIGARLT